MASRSFKLNAGPKYTTDARNDASSWRLHMRQPGPPKLWAGPRGGESGRQDGAPSIMANWKRCSYCARPCAHALGGTILEFSAEAKPATSSMCRRSYRTRRLTPVRWKPASSGSASGQDPIVVNLDIETPEPASAGSDDYPFHPSRKRRYQAASGFRNGQAVNAR